MSYQVWIAFSLAIAVWVAVITLVSQLAPHALHLGMMP